MCCSCFFLMCFELFPFVLVLFGGRLHCFHGLALIRVGWFLDQAWVTARSGRRWKEGTTGVPLVDAAMRELSATGYIGNLARSAAAKIGLVSPEMGRK